MATARSTSVGIAEEMVEVAGQAKLQRAVAISLTSNTWRVPDLSFRGRKAACCG